MHLHILSREQEALLPLVAQFRREYYMAGGTAIALHIGHRFSVDFDLFKKAPLRKSDIRRKLKSFGLPIIQGFEDAEQTHVIITGVKCTFFQFPYDIPATDELPSVIRMPDLLTLAAMKAFALGRRAKWKDYVDLYFILKYHYTVFQIAEKATLLFGEDFSEKLFRMQLGYFKVMDTSEEVVYTIPNPPTNDEIRAFLEAESVRLS